MSRINKINCDICGDDIDGSRPWVVLKDHWGELDLVDNGIKMDFCKRCAVALQHMIKTIGIGGDKCTAISQS